MEKTILYVIELDNGYPQCRETRYFEADPNDPGAVEETAGEVFAAYMEEYEYIALQDIDGDSDTFDEQLQEYYEGGSYSYYPDED